MRQYIDGESNPVPAWRRFRTAKHTISESDTFETVAVPENAAEAILKSDADFTIGEADDAVGFTTYYERIQLIDMSEIFIKGSAGQEIGIIWGLL